MHGHRWDHARKALIANCSARHCLSKAGLHTRTQRGKHLHNKTCLRTHQALSRLPTRHRHRLPKINVRSAHTDTQQSATDIEEPSESPPNNMGPASMGASSDGNLQPTCQHHKPVAGGHTATSWANSKNCKSLVSSSSQESFGTCPHTGDRQQPFLESSWDSLGSAGCFSGPGRSPPALTVLCARKPKYASREPPQCRNCGGRRHAHTLTLMSPPRAPAALPATSERRRRVASNVHDRQPRSWQKQP